MPKRTAVRERAYSFFSIPILLIAPVCLVTPCCAQSAGVTNFGFHSYSQGAPRNYNAGISGYPSNNSFNTGLGGMSQTTNNMVNSSQSSSYYNAQQNQYYIAQPSSSYNTQRSTQAAQNLAQQVKNFASKTPLGRAGGLLPPMSKNEMLRIFMEGGSPQSSESNAPAQNSVNTSATSTAYNNYQTAENESRKAYNAAQRARNSNRTAYNRKSDASQAEYAANNANYAAQRAESAAYNGDSQARGYASSARQAANRARANANQARYNADSAR